MRRAWHRLEPEERPLLWSWHMEAICDHLTAVSMGHLRNLVISVPPGFSKSMLAAVMWQAWEWGPLDRPYTRVLTASYNYALAERDASRFLRLIRSQWYQERWPILLDRVTLRKIQTANGGFRMPTSIGGIATGERADHFVVDDPLSAEQANSAAERARAARWIRESVPSRLVDARRSSIVIIAQRLHSDDVSGIALREMGFVELKLPMRYERGGTARTPIGPGGRVIEGGYDWERRTVEGELLEPQRFPEEDVRRLEAQMGPYAVAGQLQQRPSPRGGGFIQIEQMEIVADFPRNAAMVRVWDFAATTPGITAADPDYTAGVLAAALDGILYIVDVVRFRADPGTVER
ncbi:MAG: hypothetical protein NZM12_01065, partial [Steroidobacteraceae bacterium]|nr:hypothetical protein [Steroidobacteraceae bacterium]MDW8257979.1 terminase [Gammaproteobacteria bacterium]